MTVVLDAITRPYSTARSNEGQTILYKKNMSVVHMGIMTQDMAKQKKRKEQQEQRLYGLQRSLKAMVLSLFLEEHEPGCQQRQ